jgi:glycerol-3-phosphate O-acyltransferase
VVFVMNHRSNMDYVLVAYLAARRAALSYAVGEWARIWPLQTLIRSMGAYFIRRNSRDDLYRKVLERYVQMATAAGVTQAIYPEGGLSRDGRLGEARLGLLDYMLRTFDPSGRRDLVFVPVGINYDRTLEDRTLLLERAAAERPALTRAAAGTIRFVARNVRLALRNRWYRFGYACVNFGSPISMRQVLTDRDLDLRSMDRELRHGHVREIAEHLMAAVGAVVPVLPVSLVAAVFARDRRLRLSELELKARVQRLIEELAAAGARVYVPRRDRDYAVTVGLRMLVLRRMVRQGADGLFSVHPPALPLLEYYANAIAHLLPAAPSSAAAVAAPALAR